MPRQLARRIVDKLESIAASPLNPEHDVVALQGRPGYRLRVGGWRVIFLLDQGEMIILVLDVLTRGDAYK